MSPQYITSQSASQLTPVSNSAALSNYVLHFHGERNHQGTGNVILFPRPEDRIGESDGEIQTRERLGGLLKFYYRQAA